MAGVNEVYGIAVNGTETSLPYRNHDLVYDFTPPVITLSTPTEGGQASFATFVGQLDEPGTLTLQGSKVTLNPDLTFVAPASGLVQGQNTVQLLATDLAGNSHTLDRTFTLDSVPPVIPDTSQVAVGTPGSGQVSVNGPASNATAGDTVTMLNSRTGAVVQATVQADGSYSLQVAAEAGDQLVLTVSDPAGNTTASRVLTVAGTAAAVGVSITTPLASSTIDDDAVGVAGTFQGPANVGIEVNGYTASKVGSNFCVGDIPLQVGSNTLTVTARTPDGTSSSQQVTVNSTGSGPLQLEVDRITGIAPLTVTFSLTDNTGLNLNVINYDVDGDGNTDYSTGNPTATIAHTYTTPGCYTAAVTAQDTGTGGSLSSSRVIAVTDASEAEGQLLGTWYSFIGHLRNGSPVDALNLIYEPSRGKYSGIYTDLASDVATIADQLGSVQTSAIGEDIAELLVTRNNNGIPETFMIYLIRTPYGNWQIEGM